MSLFIFLTVVQALVAAALVGVILMQRSEGGGLGVGGSPSGLMSARGAADFLTRTTTILAIIFVILSIALAALAVGASSGREIDTSLDRAIPVAPADPLSDAALSGALPGAAAPSPPAPVNDPLAGAVQPATSPTAVAAPTPRATASPTLRATASPKAAPRPSPTAAASSPAADPSPTPAEPAPTATAT